MDHEAEVDAERHHVERDEESSDSSSRDNIHHDLRFFALEESDDSSSDDSDMSSDSRRAAELFAHLNDLHEGDDELFLEEKLLPYILDDIEEFCERLHANTFIKTIRFFLDLRLVDPESIAIPECFVKLGKAFASLVALQELIIVDYGGGAGFSGMPAATEIVRQTRQIRRLSLYLPSDSELYPAVNVQRLVDALFNVQRLADAISCHPALEEIHAVYLSSEETHFLTAILRTLPRLRKVTIDCSSEHSITELNPGSLSELLLVASLRELCLRNCGISQMGLHVIGECLCNGSLLSTLIFEGCQLPREGAASLASALEHNNALEELHFGSCGPDPTFYSALKDALSANRTLATLTVNGVNRQIHDQCLSMAFKGLKTNQSLQSLQLLNFCFTDGVCDALRASLEENSALRRLSIRGSHMNDDSWRRIFPFLGTNSTLKSLDIEDRGLTEAIIPDMVEALEMNSCLERLRIDSLYHINSAALVNFVGSMTRNVSLKELILGYSDFSFAYEGDAVNLVAAAKRNYGLEKLNVFVDDYDQGCLLQCILRLNEAGRRYLIDDPTSKERGVNVLLKVQDDLNCLFLHLQENPLLCSTCLTANGRGPRPLA